MDALQAMARMICMLAGANGQRKECNAVLTTHQHRIAVSDSWTDPRALQFDTFGKLAVTCSCDMGAGGQLVWVDLLAGQGPKTTAACTCLKRSSPRTKMRAWSCRKHIWVHNTIMIASHAAFKDRHPRLFSAASKFGLSLHGRAAVVWWP
jgi:hypothetical protein